MLKHITIRNFALIEHVEIEFRRGFSVITGETGHGKSVFLHIKGFCDMVKVKTEQVTE